VEKMLTEKEYNEFRKITFEDIEKNNILLKEEIKNLLEYLKKEKSACTPIFKSRLISSFKKLHIQATPNSRG